MLSVAIGLSLWKAHQFLWKIIKASPLDEDIMNVTI